MKKQIFYFSVLFTFLSFMASTSEASSALKLVFGGDTYFGESYGVHEIGSTSGDEPGIYDSSIKELSALPLSANWCMVNMEAPLSFPIPNEAVDKNLHWANPDKTASTLKRHGIKAVTAGYLLFPLFWLFVQHQYKGEVPAFSITFFTLTK